MRLPDTKKTRKHPRNCPCGNPLKTADERSILLCNACLDTGIPTERSKIPIPKGSCLGNPEDLGRQSLDRLLWFIDWWNASAQQSTPEEAEYLACRLEELAAKIRRTV